MRNSAIMGYVGAMLLLGGCGMILGFEEGVAKEEGIACQGYTVLCSEQCVDLHLDVANCGSCGNACQGGQICDNGMCACPNGTIECNGVCVNPASDAQNCGTCTTVCGGNEECAQGVCTPRCASGKLWCNDACEDSNEMHCASCMDSCSNGETCVDRHCVNPCKGPLGFPGPPLTPINDENHDERMVLLDDLDGDSVPDMVTATTVNDNQAGYPYGVNVRMGLKNGQGKGNGTFGPKTFYQVGAVSGAEPTIALADMDDDKDLDVVVAAYQVQNVTILYNRKGKPGGDGVLDSRADTVGQRARTIAVGQFGGDGLLDIALAGYGSNLTVIINNSSGFNPPVDIGIGYPARSIVAEDFDKDGHWDIATANYDSQGSAPDLYGTVSIFLGNGNASFQVPPNSAPHVAPYPYELVVGQFDSDSKPDIAVRDSGKTINILKNTSAKGAPSFVVSAPFAAPASINDIASGNFRGNALADVAFTINSGTSSGYYVLPIVDGVWAQPLKFPAYYLSNLAVGDVDGNGLMDLATAVAYPKAVSIHFNETQMGVLDFLDPVSFDGAKLIGAANIDPNVDGDIDLIGFTSSSVVMSANDGTGAYPNLSSKSMAGTIQDGIVAKIDEDAFVDLAVTNTSKDTIDILYGDGTGTFPEPAPIAVKNLGGAIATGYLRGPKNETNPDLVVTLESGGGWAYLSNLGGRMFRTPPSIYGTGKTYQAITTGQFDDDGTQDVAVTNTNPKEIAIFRSKNGGFLAQNPISVAFVPGKITAADLDGDGDDDLVVASSDGINVFRNDNGFGGYTPYATSAYDRPIVGDLNGDLRPDIMFVSYYSVGVLLNVGQAEFATPVYYPIANDSVSAIVAGDFQLDNHLDIAGSNSGKFEVMLNRCLE